jgi:hypothetical protein
MKTRTTLKAGVRYPNNNETLVKDRALKIKSRIRGGLIFKMK